jgi:hypothetical protein
MSNWRALWRRALRRDTYRKESLTALLKHGVRWSYRKLPPGLRTLAGVLLVIGGCLGFLPILGFWMLPLGLLLIGLDIPPLHRRLVAWAEDEADG